MSIATLLVPNDLQLFCGSITTSEPNSSERFYRVDQNTSGQTIPNGATTPIQFPNPVMSANFPAPGGTLPSTVFTAPISGFYNISYSFNITKSSGTGQIYAWIAPGGATLYYGTCNTNQFEAGSMTVGPPVSNITYAASATDRLSASALVPLTAGQGFQIQVTQTTGVIQDITPGGGGSPTVITVDYAHGF